MSWNKQEITREVYENLRDKWSEKLERTRWELSRRMEDLRRTESDILACLVNLSPPKDERSNGESPEQPMQ